jgi:hypothetical protein
MFLGEKPHGAAAYDTTVCPKNKDFSQKFFEGRWPSVGGKANKEAIHGVSCKQWNWACIADDFCVGQDFSLYCRLEKLTEVQKWNEVVHRERGRLAFSETGEYA